MAPIANSGPGRSGLERVRHELLTAMHFGKLGPGDRAPSVRRLADLTGMNRKTIHRAYTRLASEGFLDLRPGSGSYIAERAPVNDLLAAADRCRSSAQELGLDPAVFTAFLDVYLADGLRELPLAVVECNREQLALIAAALHTELGIAPRPVLLSRLKRDAGRAANGCWAIVTTDCHRAEATTYADGSGMPVFRVALDTAFPERLVRHASRGPLVMVVDDLNFAPVFTRMLIQMETDPELIRRFSIVTPAAARAIFRRTTVPTTVYRSPLVPVQTLGPLPENVHLLKGRWQIASNSLERLKASLALDVATRGRPEMLKRA